jgi:hypothetical protein
MAIGQKTRFEVFKRDKFTCQYCGRRPPEVMLQIDHIVPVARGGTGEVANLATSCFDCNSGKSDRPLGDVAPAVDENEALAAIQTMMERKAALKAKIKATRALTKIQRMAVADARAYWQEIEGFYLTASEQQSFDRFAERLDPAQMVEAMQATKRFHGIPYKTHSQAFLYFCAICWKMIKAAPLASSEASA